MVQIGAKSTNRTESVILLYTRINTKGRNSQWLEVTLAKKGIWVLARKAASLTLEKSTLKTTVKFESMHLRPFDISQGNLVMRNTDFKVRCSNAPETLQKERKT